MKTGKLVPIAVMLIQAFVQTTYASELLKMTFVHGQTAPWPSGSKVVAFVGRIKGFSQIHRPEKNKLISVISDQKIFKRDALITKKSKIHLLFKNGTQVELGENSKLVIEEFRFRSKRDSSPDEFIYRLDQGVLRMVTTTVEPDAHFYVKTLNAIFKVSPQTEFYLIETPDEHTVSVRVVKGKLEAISVITNESVSLSENSGAIFKTSGLATQTRSTHSDELSSLRLRTQI